MEKMENEENVLRSKLSLIANNNSEKMAILEARDKLLRLRRHRQTNLATAVAVVGACPDMCPEYERYFRVETNQLTSLEMDCNDSNVEVNHNKMVKEYRRSGADQEEPLPHELRPTYVLNRTMDYLCTNIMDNQYNQSVSIGEWYDFVWSRTRSIRKDMTQQHLCDLSSVALTEKCARFHIHCAATLCEENIKDFDPKINEENLSNCLQSLKDFYYDLSLRDIYCENEAEFRSYDILLHLNDSKILRDVKNYRKQIRDCPQVRFAIQAFYSYQSNNYIKFFNLAQNCDYLMSCVMHRYFTHVRQQAFKILRKSYTSNSSSVQEYSNHLLVQYLGFENDQHLQEFCSHIGLECNDNVVVLVRGLNDTNAVKEQRSMRLVENKRNSSVGQIIYGSPLPVNPYKSVPVHDSFDSDGRLKADAFEALDQQMKTNVFNNPSINVNTSVNSDSKPIFGSLMSSKPTFNVPLSSNSSSIFSNSTVSKTLFGSSLSSQQSMFNFSLDSSIKQETKLNPFSMTSPSTSLQFPAISFSQTPKPSISDEIKPFLLPPQIHINQVSIPETPLDSNIITEEMIESLCESISTDLIDFVSKELLFEICGQELQNIRSFVFNEMVCKLFSDILLSLTDNMIKEIAFNVIQEEKDLKAKEKEIIENLSIGITDEMIDDFVYSNVRSISEDVYNQSYEELTEKENEIIANDLFNDSINIIVEDIAAEVFVEANDERELLVENLKQRRLNRLEEKYFNKWRNWFLKRKRYEYYRKSFPAAPNWNSNNSQTNLINYTNSQNFLNNSFKELIENEMSANNFLNYLINIIVRDIATEVYVNAINGREILVERLKQNKFKRLERMYFNKWKNCYLERKRLEMHKKSFPAAPNWNSNNSISCKIKYTYSEIEPNEEIRALKRVRRETSQQNSLPSNNDLKALLNEEMSESKALTKRLNEALEPTSHHIFLHSFHRNECDIEDNSQTHLTQEEDEEADEENEVPISDLFETSTDKMNRLKRMLAEEQNYVSLKNFVSYLANNQNTNQENTDYE